MRQMAREAGQLLTATLAAWSSHRCSRMAAALAYYTVFALAPLLVIAIGVAGLAFGTQAAQGQIVAEIEGLVGHESASLIQTLVLKASEPRASWVATVFGVIMLIAGASGVFAELQDALTLIWGAEVAPRRGLRDLFINRLFAFALVLALGGLLIASLFLTSTLARLSHIVESLAPSTLALSQWFNQAATIALTALLFGIVFKVLPRVKTPWRDVWPGAILTALLFALGRYVIGLYLSRVTITSSFGAAGSLVTLLLWVYYSAQVFFLGAEFTQVYAQRRKTLALKITAENTENTKHVSKTP